MIATRKEAPKNYWKRPAPDLPLGRENFRVYLQHPKKPRVNINALVDSITWTDAGPIVTGTLGFHEPPYLERSGKPVPFDVETGDRIHIQWSRNGEDGWKALPYGPFRVVAPSTDVLSGSTALEFANDLDLLHRSKLDWRYVKDKKHPKGWKTGDIIKDVAKRMGLRLGPMPRLRHRVKKLVRKKTSPLDIISLAFRMERQANGRRFFLGMRDGRLSAWAYRRDSRLLVFRDLITSAAYSESYKEQFATVLIARGELGKKKGSDDKEESKSKRKVRVTIRDKEAVKRYGAVHRQWKPKGAETKAEVRDMGKRELARRIRPVRELIISHPGIPNVERGHALRINLGAEIGLKQIVYVSGITHSVQPGNYSIEPVLTFTDPFKDKRHKKKKDEKKKDPPKNKSRRDKKRDD